MAHSSFPEPQNPSPLATPQLPRVPVSPGPPIPPAQSPLSPLSSPSLAFSNWGSPAQNPRPALPANRHGDPAGRRGGGGGSHKAHLLRGASRQPLPGILQRSLVYSPPSGPGAVPLPQVPVGLPQVTPCAHAYPALRGLGRRPHGTQTGLRATPCHQTTRSPCSPRSLGGSISWGGWEGNGGSGWAEGTPRGLGGPSWVADSQLECRSQPQSPQGRLPTVVGPPGRHTFPSSGLSLPTWLHGPRAHSSNWPSSAGGTNSEQHKDPKALRPHPSPPWPSCLCGDRLGLMRGTWGPRVHRVHPLNPGVLVPLGEDTQASLPGMTASWPWPQADPLLHGPHQFLGAPCQT